MDPRHQQQQPPPQLPFSRNGNAAPGSAQNTNTTTAFGRPPFPPASSQPPPQPPLQPHAQHPHPHHHQQQHQQHQPPSHRSPPQPAHQQPPPPQSQHYSPSAHPSHSTFHADLHTRKHSDPIQYYAGPPRHLRHESGPMMPPAHSRHPSASSITSGPGPVNRAMPPPTSPPQQGPPPQGPPPQSHQQQLQQPPPQAHPQQHPQQHLQQHPGPHQQQQQPTQPPHPSQQGPPPNAHQMGGSYGIPPPRAPPVAIGPPNAFPRDRQLPALETLPRTGSGSSMSISSMLGGPPPARDPGVPAGPYPPGPPSGVSGPPYNQPMHASPRMHTMGGPGPDFGFRRPQTPDRHRLFDGRDPRDPRDPRDLRDPRDPRDPRGDPRDPRTGIAASPSGGYTPEVQRYGTPQVYSNRGPPLTAAEQAREQARMAGTGVPPRPNSQPKSFPNAPPPRPMEMGRPPPSDMYGHREDRRAVEEYNPERPIRVPNYEEQRFMTERERQERERQEREFQEMRERERRERTMSGSDAGRPHPMQQAEYARQMEHQRAPPQFGRPPDPREQGHWHRPSFEQPRGPYDQPGHMARHPHEHPVTTAPPYNGHPSYATGPPPDRYPPSSLPPHQQHSMAAHGPGPMQFESPDRQRMNMMHMEQRQQQQQQQHQHPYYMQHQQLPPRSREDQPVPPPSVAYSGVGTGSLYGSPRSRHMEELAPPGHQRNLLGIQEINRKGRISPLPQAVQGAQPQLAGPTGEPGIKSEFGRMFSGIGTGVGAMSPIPTGMQQLPFTGASLMRREDSDGVPQPQELAEPGAKGPGRGKRRKLKDDESRIDEDSTGRLTPVGGRGKKAKTHHTHHHHHHHHHHHRHDLQQGPGPALMGNTPFKNVTGAPSVPPPNAMLAKDLPTTHHHHHVVPRSVPHPNNGPAKAAPVQAPSPPPVQLPKPKHEVKSKEVLKSVANLPRSHLGEVVYDPKLAPSRRQDSRTKRPPRQPFKSTPRPLPWDLIQGKENCTLTVKISKAYLTSEAREEITSRRALWGTDIYTDDSDVIAACIHAGWFRGEWPEEVDTTFLGLDEAVSNASDILTSMRNGPQAVKDEAGSEVYSEPPQNGPMAVPANRDLHVTLLILPKLEKYASTARFGIKSREWGSVLEEGDGIYSRSSHDGLSFAIMDIRWLVNGAQPVNRLRGKARRDRINKALREIAQSPPFSSFNKLGQIRLSGTPQEQREKESDEGQQSSKWWPSAGTGRKAAADEDKENHQPGESVEGPKGKEKEGEKEAEKEPEKEQEEQREEDQDGDVTMELEPKAQPAQTREKTQEKEKEKADDEKEDVEMTDKPAEDEATETSKTVEEDKEVEKTGEPEPEKEKKQEKEPEQEGEKEKATTPQPEAKEAEPEPEPAKETEPEPESPPASNLDAPAKPPAEVEKTAAPESETEPADDNDDTIVEEPEEAAEEPSKPVEEVAEAAKPVTEPEAVKTVVTETITEVREATAPPTAATDESVKDAAAAAPAADADQPVADHDAADAAAAAIISTITSTTTTATTTAPAAAPTPATEEAKDEDKDKEA